MLAPVMGVSNKFNQKAFALAAIAVEYIFPATFGTQPSPMKWCECAVFVGGGCCHSHPLLYVVVSLLSDFFTSLFTYE